MEVTTEAAVATMMLFHNDSRNVRLAKICSYHRRLHPSNGNTSDGLLWKLNMPMMTIGA
ncbi:hypothetical protein D3C84_972210 [compost metagenome]